MVFLSFHEWLVWRESKGQTPDYSIDRWLQMADELGQDTTLMRNQADQEEKRMDSEIDKKKTKSSQKEEKFKKPYENEDDDPETRKAKKQVFNDLVALHKEKKDKDKKNEPDKEGKPARTGGGKSDNKTKS